MKLKLYKKYLFAGVVASTLASCSSENDVYVVSPETILLTTQIENIYGDTDALLLPSSNLYTEIPQDPKNPITAEKVALGQMLFHETSIALNPKMESGKNTYSCASCHHAEAGFQSGLQQGIGEGGIGFGNFGETRQKAEAYHDSILDVQPVRSPTILNSAYQKVMLWNGQFGATGPNTGTTSKWTIGTPKEVNFLGFEGVETQAIAGIEVHRLTIDSTYIKNSNYKALFDAAFGDIPEVERYTKVNAGLAIAAYERSVLPNQAPFQKWLQGDSDAMTDEEKQGASIFFGKGECYTCHTGPALNDMKFHALGMNDLSGPNVHGEVDDATKKGRGGFTNNPSDDYTFKTPTIYNLKNVNFLGHGGSFKTVSEIINYKNTGVAENTNVPNDNLSPDFKPLGLSEAEVNQLTTFVWNALYDPNLSRYTPESLPSGNCFPNGDSTSKSDMGCN